jgi:hypothetical protein
MKRIVRLTESDLTRIVRRVINEQETSDMEIYVYPNPDPKRGDMTVSPPNNPFTIIKHEQKGNFIDLTTDRGAKLSYMCKYAKGMILIPGTTNSEGYGQNFFLDKESVDKLTQLCQTYGL